MRMNIRAARAKLQEIRNLTEDIEGFLKIDNPSMVRTKARTIIGIASEFEKI